MKQYFITLDYTQSNLSAMERDLLDQAKPFDNCLIYESQIDVLVDYFRKMKGAFRKANPKRKEIEISKWPAGPNVIYIHVGQICLHMQEVKDLPQTFKDLYGFITKG